MMAVAIARLRLLRHAGWIILSTSPAIRTCKSLYRRTGFCLQAGADVIVNLDADNQYCAEDIPRLIEPILLGQAEIVVGARAISRIKHFSPAKKFLQKLGSWVVRIASNTDIPDAPVAFALSATRRLCSSMCLMNTLTP